MDNNMVDKLKAMLDDPATLNTLSALLGSMQPPDHPAEAPQTVEDVPTEQEESQPSIGSVPQQAEAMAKIQQMLSQSSVVDDPRINLLSSLKPYMRKNRSAKMDQAIRLIQISKMANLFKP